MSAQQQQQQHSQGLASSPAGRIVLTARVVSRNNGGLNVVCMGLQALLPKSLLPFKIRDLYQQQVRPGFPCPRGCATCGPLLDPGTATLEQHNITP